MSLLDVMRKKSGEAGAKRVCIVCGREATGGCGLCYRDALELAEEEAQRTGSPAKKPIPLALCSADVDPACSNRHAKERHSAGLVGELDPRWQGQIVATPAAVPEEEEREPEKG